MSRHRRRIRSSSGHMSIGYVKSKEAEYLFAGSDAKLEWGPEFELKKLANIPRQLPIGCEISEFKSSGNDLLDFYIYHVRIWVLDFLAYYPPHRWEIHDFAKMLVSLGVSEQMEGFILGLASESDGQVTEHFSNAILECIAEQADCEVAAAKRLRPAFNEKVGRGASALGELEIRFISGLVAKGGYLEHFLDIEEMRFINNLDLVDFAKTHCLRLNPGVVHHALSPEGHLFSGFFIDVDYSSERDWRNMSVTLGNSILNSLPKSITTGAMRKAARGYELKEHNLAKLDDVIIETEVKDRLKNLLDFYKMQVAEKEKATIRILLRGVPGSGKSMLSEAIADYLGVGALAVNLSSVRSKATFYLLSTFSERARASNTVLVLEESEQLLSVNPYTGQSDDTAKLMFEDYEGAVIFTTNVSGSSRWFEPTEAIERRMDLIIDFEMPGPEHRERILTQEIKKWQDKGWRVDMAADDIKEISKSINLSGGFLPQALKQAASASMKDKIISKEILHDCLGYVAEKSNASKSSGQAEYSDIVLDQVVLPPGDRLVVDRFIKYARELTSKKDRNPILPQGATFLFSGPPGTGKTMTAQAIAKELEMKIRICSASDFLSMYVGGTEQNIKRIFASCERKKELLFIDEIEGLLHSRASSVRSWETTQVNEFLKAIESFKGVMIGATNHAQMMDPAFARRFLFNIKLPMPSPAERLTMWQTYLAGLKVDEAVVREIAQRYELSGGEIRNAAIRAQVSEVMTYTGIERICLEVEASRTGEVQRRIGVQ